jgi:hypothetical protein
MTGMTTASITAVASNRIVFSACPIGPFGASTPSSHEASIVQADATSGTRQVRIRSARVRKRHLFDERSVLSQLYLREVKWIAQSPR